MESFEVLVTNDEAKRLDKYAVETLGAKKESERKLFFSRKRYVVYTFEEHDNAVRFLFGIRKIFGPKVLLRNLEQ